MDGTRTDIAEDLATIVPGLATLWAQTRGDPRVGLAVLDGPVDLAHPCLAGADLVTLPTLVPQRPTAGSATRHGTAVVSILFGRHGSGVAGVAPGCRGLIAPMFGETAGGEIEPASQTDLARAISQAVEAHAQIINISGGQRVESADMDWPLDNAMKACADEGVLVVAAAGNDGCACIHLPAAAPGVLVVGAMDAGGDASSFSNFGHDYARHGIVAPGESIPAATPGGAVGRVTGTSYATPIVAGVAALLMSRELARGRRLRAADIFDVLFESAISCDTQPAPDCRRLFRGRLNIDGAIRLLDGSAGGTTMAETTVAAAKDDLTREAGVAPAGTGLPPPEPATAAPSAGSSPPAAAPAATLAMSAAPVAKPPAQVAEPAAPAVAPAAPVAAPPADPAPCFTAPMALTPSAAAGGCGCGGGGLVFALGTLGFDFGSDALRERLRQTNGGAPIYDSRDLASYLAGRPSDAEYLIWTLSIDTYPVYALRPTGPFGAATYARLTQFLSDPEVERIAVPGVETGGVETLIGGQVVPVITPDLPGLSSWSTSALVGALTGSQPQVPGLPNPVLVSETLRTVLGEVYHGRRNLGATPRERALNFAVTNAYALHQIVVEATTAGLELASVDTEKSPLCRPESDCWDVKLTFFDPVARSRLARRVYRFTIDVSDVEPVQIGSTRNWQVH